jgi:hypothetical protein
VRNDNRVLPLLQFDQGIADVANREGFVAQGLGSLLQVTGLSNAKRESLSEIVKQKLLRPNPKFGEQLLAQVRKDLTLNIDLIKALIIRTNAGSALETDKLNVNVEQVGKDIQKFETNLQQLLGMSPEQEHELLSSVVVAAANLNQRMAYMQEFDAISLFEESEGPLIFGKIHGIIRPLNPTWDEHAFLRVLEFTDIPTMLASGRIDVEKLLTVRETSECREFRAWLSTTDKLDDKQLAELVSGFKSKASAFVSSPVGKSLRLAVNTGLGLLPVYGSLMALGEGAVDMFLTDKLLPNSGVLSFLSKEVPSIFTKH